MWKSRISLKKMLGNIFWLCFSAPQVFEDPSYPSNSTTFLSLFLKKQSNKMKKKNQDTYTHKPYKNENQNMQTNNKNSKCPIKAIWHKVCKNSTELALIWSSAVWGASPWDPTGEIRSRLQPASCLGWEPVSTSPTHLESAAFLIKAW